MNTKINAGNVRLRKYNDQVREDWAATGGLERLEREGREGLEKMLARVREKFCFERRERWGND